MEENFEELGHGLQRPHLSTTGFLPDGFVPLHLELRTLDQIPQVRTLEIDRPNVVMGRHSEADVCLAFPDVSRRHCRLSFHEGCWHIADLNSLNGLFVNGERTHEAVLQEGDYVRVGGVTFIVMSSVPVESHPWTGVLRSIANNLE